MFVERLWIDDGDTTRKIDHPAWSDVEAAILGLDGTTRSAVMLAPDGSDEHVEPFAAVHTNLNEASVMTAFPPATSVASQVAVPANRSLTGLVLGSFVNACERLSVPAVTSQKRNPVGGGAFTVAASSRVTLVTEFLGRRLASGGRLVDVVEPHPSLVGVETIRLSATEQATHRVQLAAGLRWNVASRFLFSMNVLRPLTTAGLNARWMTTASFDYTLGN